MHKKRIFKRWYDQDYRLKQLIETLEKMMPDHQQLFGCMIFEFPELVLQKEKQTMFMESLSFEKVKGLLKSREKRRWYDQDPVVQRAMNFLYSLASSYRANIAQKFLTPAILVYEYEQYCLQCKESPNENKVQEILENCFCHGNREARRIYQDLLQSSRVFPRMVLRKVNA